MLLELTAAHFLIACAVFVALSLLLFRFARSERRAVLNAGILFLFCALMVGSAIALLRAGLPSPAKYLEFLGVLGLGIALLRQLAITIFRLLLPTVRIFLPRIHQDIAAAVGYVVWGFVWLRENEVDLTSLIATSAVVTAVIAFSLQDTLGNILGGVAIQLDRSVRVGDWIQVGNSVGRVVEIRWRQTSIETRNWETVLIPNSELVKNSFYVLGRRIGEPVLWRRWVRFNVDFRYSPARVIEVVEKAVRLARISNVAARPEPNCITTGFEESYCTYAVRYWLVDLAVDDPTDSEVRTHIYFALKRAGIDLSIPAHAVFLTEDTAERKETKQKRHLQQRIHALRGVDLFGKLTQEEIEELAQRLIPAPFAEGDVMTRAGQTAHWLYIIIQGEADVIVQNREERSRQVASLGPGSCFGEKGLLTGEPRSATVIARTEVECYRLDRESFQQVLQSRPELADEMSILLAQRKVELEAALDNLDAETRASRLAHAHTDILDKIRHFFRLDS